MTRQQQAPALHETIRTAVKRELARQNLTQRDLAVRLGITEQHVSQILGGRRTGWPALMATVEDLGMTVVIVGPPDS